jgi:uncharacterized protein YdiU (UPF0061 family)
MRSKLGLFTEEPEDKALVDDLLLWMERTSADFTNTFRNLTMADRSEDARRLDAQFDAWHSRLDARRARQTQSRAEAEALMRAHKPAFIPRNHKVEEALQAASGNDDFTVMQRLLDVLATPYDHDRDLPAFSAPGDSRTYRTFCGT